ncbi:MAG: argininosuccinate synthase [Alphaproteobacteria bacterium]|nr:argininosuccinate synthase [Alphaproteobacteria bacterium]
MTKQKVVLAYSGGLDTSVILKWLMEEGYEVIAYMADVGQKEDFAAAKEKALKIGASKVYVEDLKKEFITDYIFPAFSANAVYEGRYLLGTSLARPIIAKRQIEIAALEGAVYVSHGATGKGNDQVRFELAYYALNPEIQVLAPWKMQNFLDQFKGRGDMLAYADKYSIPVTATASKPYSEDDNLLHISHEAGILEDPNVAAGEDVYSHTCAPELAPDVADMITLSFEKGFPTKVVNQADGTTATDPLELFLYLNTMGAKHGIGRLDMVENRYVGIKSRGVYETPGGEILLQAHKDIEGLTMDREVMHLRDMLTLKIADVIYNGYWFSPEMEFLLHAIEKSQENVDGDVTLKLYKGMAYPVARKSEKSLYSPELSSMDEEGGYNQEDAQGFIKINAIRLKTNPVSAAVVKAEIAA